MPSEIPSFAQLWIQQWKAAAPRLQAIRDEELRRLGDKSSQAVEGIRIYEQYPDRHGMVVMQRWFMRKELFDNRKVRNKEQQGAGH